MQTLKTSLSYIVFSIPWDVKRRIAILAILLLSFTFIIWFLAFTASITYPLLLGLVLLSYGFGLRHAVDADHIAAIDNTTRKLIGDGKKPIAVGFFFSLGHSTIVVALCLLIATSASFVQKNLPEFAQMGSFIGAIVSCLFLLIIGGINLLSLLEIVSTWQQVIKGKKRIHKETLEEFLSKRGIVTRILRPLLKMVNHSRDMYIIGFLFGLGFDTATEIGLLSIAAATATQGMPIWMVMLLPLAFTAGMTLIDTLDGMLMLGAYGWAYVKPIRKLYYNMNITFISVVTAFFIGGVEGLQIVSEKTGITAGILGSANSVNLGNVGYFIIALFTVSFFASIAIYRIKQYDLLDKAI